MRKQNIGKRHILIFLLTFFLCFSIIVCSAVPAAAVARFTGLKEIITENSEENPFTILELVPDHQYDSLGFLVPGEEPINWYGELEKREYLSDRQSYVTDLMLRLNPIIFSIEDGSPLNASAIYTEYYNEKMMLSVGDKEEEWHLIQFENAITEQRKGNYQPANGGNYTRVEERVQETDEEGNEINRVVGYSYEYTPGSGNYTWVDDVNGDYQDVTYREVYCRLNITNNDWLKTKIFQLAPEEAFYTDIISMTPAELNKALSEGTVKLENVDMLYVSDSTFVTEDYFEAHSQETLDKVESGEISQPITNDATVIECQPYSMDNDISEFCYNIIKEHIDSTRIAVVLDYQFWKESLTEDSLRNTNIYKFYADKEDIYSQLPRNDADAESVDADGCFVSGSTFVTNRCLTGKTLTDIYTADREKGYEEIKEAIENENFYIRSGAGEDSSIETITEDISDAAVLRYIISVRYQHPIILKDEIKVLQIEPANDYSDLSESEILKWANDENKQIIHSVDIERMNVNEFVGKIEDLNEAYDFIYIGSNIGEENAEGSYNQIDGKTVYNDPDMNGLIYTHIGDVISADICLNGLLSEDYRNLNKDGQFAKENSFRYSGTDLTEPAYKKLLNFAESGYPVIFSEDIYILNKEEIRSVNEDKIDSSSFMYKLANDLKNRENVMSVRSDKRLIGSKSHTIGYQTFNKYLNMPKLQVNMLASPPEYHYTLDEKGIHETSVLAPDSSGKYLMEYEFELKDIAVLAPEAVRYVVKMYTDTNGDGQYTSNEALDSLQVVESATGNSVDVDNLKAGIRYRLVRTLPDNDTGVVAWQLTFEKKDSSGIRTSATGYTALEIQPGKREKLNILQIHQRNNTSFDLEKQLSSDETVFGSLINFLPAFDIRVKTITIDEYNRNCESYNFEEYDMLILGFSDTYGDISGGRPIEKIKSFIEEGKAVLFSNDCTSYWNADSPSYYSGESGETYWGYSFNSQIRSLAGMDRFGVREPGLEELQNLTGVLTKTMNPVLWQAIGSSGKDYAYLPKSEGTSIVKEVQGYTNKTLDRYYSSSQGNYHNRAGIADGGNITDIVNSSEKINDGQITNYPYKIPNSITDMANSHGQYYQLDLNMDKDGSGNSDVVVWYTLSGGYYNTVPKDVRNNYYAYTAGNVTYTGFGHASSGSNSSENAPTDYEAQLFVNTMITAYRSSIKKPEVRIISDVSDRNSDEDYIYLTYDNGELLNIQNGGSAWFNYTLFDSNVTEGNKRIEVVYYYRDENGKEQITPGDETVRVSVLDTSTRHLSDGTWSESDNLNDLENGGVYQADLPEALFAQIEESNDFKIYVGARAVVDTNVNGVSKVLYSAWTYDQVSVVPRSLFNLD